MILDLVASLGGMIIPPAVDFIKKKFLGGGADSEEATLSALATTSPDVLAAYVKASSELMDAKTRFFNRDRQGTVSPWVDNLRASIRPIFVLVSLAMKLAAMIFNLKLGTFRYLMEAVIGSWFGCKLIPSD